MQSTQQTISFKYLQFERNILLVSETPSMPFFLTLIISHNLLVFLPT